MVEIKCLQSDTSKFAKIGGLIIIDLHEDVKVAYNARCKHFH